MSGQILDIEGDVITKAHFDETSNKSIIETVQDIAPYLEQNKQELNAANGGWKGAMHKVASIPLVVAEQWHRELGGDPFAPENKAWLKRKLNSPDNAYLRTKKGRI